MRWKMNFLFIFAVALVMALGLSHTVYADSVDGTADTSKGSTTGTNVYYFSYYYSSSMDAIYLDVTTKNGNKDHTYTSASDNTVISSQNPVCSVSMDTALANLISQGAHTSCTVESLKSDLNALGYYDNGNGIWISYDATAYLTYVSVSNLPSVVTYTVTYDGNGGSGIKRTQTLTYGDTFTTLSSTTFSRTGYRFSCWNTSADGSGTSYAAAKAYTYSMQSDVTLYAQWVDDTSPTGTISAKPSSWSSGDGTVSVTAQDTGSGLASVVLRRYSYSSVSWSTVKTTTYSGTIDSQSISYTESDEGIFFYKAIITDKSGNSYEVTSSAIYLDHSNPIATVSVSETDWTNTAPTISVDATDYLLGTSYTGSGIESVVIMDSDGETVASATNSSASTLSSRTRTAEVSYTLDKEYEGIYTWTITATDFVGKIYSETVTTKYDCTKPAIVGTEETTILSSGVVTSAYMTNNIISQSINDYASNSSNSPNAVSGLKSVVVYKVTNELRTILSRQSFSVVGETLDYEYYSQLPTSEKSIDYYQIAATDYAGNIAQKKLVSKQSVLTRFRTSIDRSSYR